MLPVRLLLAVSASIPEPADVKEPAPLMTPENVVVALLTESVLLGDVARVAGPLKVTLLPAMVEVPLTTTGLLTVNAEVAWRVPPARYRGPVPSTPPSLRLSVPPPSAVPPEYVFPVLVTTSAP